MAFSKPNIDVLPTVASNRSKDLNNLVLSDESFEKWRKFIYDKTGIYFQNNKKYLLESRLIKQLVNSDFNTFDDYLNFLQKVPSNNPELLKIYNALTINETFFFRNQPQLDALIYKVIPELIEFKKKLNQNKIRIWSAASSSGEELYSICISLNEFIIPKYSEFKFELIGTDINSTVIDQARKGIYNEYSIRNLPIQYLKKYFSKNEDYYELSPAIRNMAQFITLNLFDNQAMSKMINFDIIFCSNVLIYFNLESKIKVVNNLFRSLNKNGYLFIGFSESLHGISKAFRLISFTKTVGYKKE